MKKIGILLLLCISIVGCKNKGKKAIESAMTSISDSNSELKRYEIKSGSIIYKTTISGKVMGTSISGTGSETLHFKEWGAVEVVEEETDQSTVTKIFGNTTTDKSSTHTMHKLDNGDSYSVDFERKEIRKNSDMAMEMTKMFHKDADAGKVGKELFESMGGKQLGTEVVLGYECEIWDLMGIKQWMYKGVLIKSEGTLMGIHTLKEATSAKFNLSIPNADFELPDFPIVEEEGFMGDESFEFDEEEMQEGIDRIKDISFEDWKKLATADDPEMQAMSEEELHETYDMIQKMIQMRQ